MAEHDCWNVVEAAFEAAKLIVGLQKIGCELKNYEAQQTFDLVLLGLSQSEPSGEEFVLLAVDCAGHLVMKSVLVDLEAVECLASATAKFNERKQSLCDTMAKH